MLVPPPQHGCVRHRVCLHRLALPVWGVGIAGVDLAIALLCLVHLFHSAGILLRDLTAGWSISDRRQLWSSSGRIIGALRLIRITRRWGIVATVGCALTFFFSLSLILLLLLALLPFFANFLELCGMRSKLVSANTFMVIHQTPTDRNEKIQNKWRSHSRTGENTRGESSENAS